MFANVFRICKLLCQHNAVVAFGTCRMYWKKWSKKLGHRNEAEYNATFPFVSMPFFAYKFFPQIFRYRLAISVHYNYLFTYTTKKGKSPTNIWSRFHNNSNMLMFLRMVQLWYFGYFAEIQMDRRISLSFLHQFIFWNNPSLAVLLVHYCIHSTSYWLGTCLFSFWFHVQLDVLFNKKIFLQISPKYTIHENCSWSRKLMQIWEVSVRWW